MAKASTKSRTRRASAAPAPTSAVAPSTGPAAAVPVAVETPGSKVPGILDSKLHATLHEAHRVLQVGIDAWLKVIDQCEGQYLRPLLNAHDGDSPACVDIQAQIAAFRALYR